MNFILYSVTRTEFEALKDSMLMYQKNIDNNITWFYASLAIMVAILIVSLIVIVRASISKGIETGIEKTHKNIEELIDEKKNLLHASGNVSVSVDQGNLMQVYGLMRFNKYNFVNLTIVNRFGRICEYHSLDIKDDGELRGFDVKVVDYNPKRDGMILYWNVIWLNDTSYEELLKS